MRDRTRSALLKRSRWWQVMLTLFSVLLVSSWARAAVVYQTTSDWGTGFNGEITVTNATTKAVTDWTVAFDFDRKINNIWDATVVSVKNNHYVIKSAGWNSTIASGGKVSFGFGGSPGNLKTPPTNFVLSSGGTAPTPTPTKPTATPTPKPTATPTPKPGATATSTPKPTSTPVPQPTATPKPGGTPTPQPSGFQATITQTSRWNGGFGGSLELVNGTNQTVNGWTLVFNFVPHIDSLWGGIMTSAGNTYTVKNESWNGTLAPGAKITLGFSATGELDADSASKGIFNGAQCAITCIPGTSTPGATGSGIVIGNGVDTSGEAVQITVGQNGVVSYPLSMSNGAAANLYGSDEQPCGCDYTSDQWKHAANTRLEGGTRRFAFARYGQQDLPLRWGAGAQRRWFATRFAFLPRCRFGQ